ncbi:hypothetical protein FBU31_005817 [Coemansia sp. 'formosensis']|nr:hypothetical protein FBU31_005817 [Coemansia sp. 'formosensis']
MFKVAMTRRVVDRQSTGRRITRDDMRRYFQHPSLNPPTISTDDVAHLAQEYHDDSVFTTLLADHASNLTKVTPQATLVAEEEEHLLEGDSEIIKSMVIAELQRFGRIPVTSTPQVNVSSTSGVSAMAAANLAASAASNSSRPRMLHPPLPPLPQAPPPSAASTSSTAVSIDTTNPMWYDIRRQKVNVVKVILEFILTRLAELLAFPPEHDKANKTREGVAHLFNDWHGQIIAYVNDTGADKGRRHGELLINALPSLCTNVFCMLVVHLHICSDEELQRYIFKTASMS